MVWGNKVGSYIGFSILSTKFCGTHVAIPQMYIANRSVTSRKLFVGGISYTTKEEDLKKAFAPHGNILEARISIDPYSKFSKGFGFVEFASVEEAEAARRSMNGKALGGKHIRVAFAASEKKATDDEQPGRIG